MCLLDVINACAPCWINESPVGKNSIAVFCHSANQRPLCSLGKRIALYDRYPDATIFVHDDRESIQHTLPRPSRPVNNRPHLIEVNCSPALGLDEPADRCVAVRPKSARKIPLIGYPCGTKYRSTTVLAPTLSQPLLRPCYFTAFLLLVFPSAHAREPPGFMKKCLTRAIYFPLLLSEVSLLSSNNNGVTTVEREFGETLLYHVGQ